MQTMMKLLVGETSNESGWTTTSGLDNDNYIFDNLRTKHLITVIRRTTQKIKLDYFL